MPENNAVNDILEIVQFLKENAASKTDLAAVESRLDQKIENEISSVRNDMKAMESRLTDHIDGFAKVQERFDQELAALQGKYERHEEMFQKLFKHLQLDQRSL